MASEQLFPTLEPAVGGSFVAFRWSDYDVPFWARPNSRPGRWNRLGDRPTQYWSLAPEAAWAELIKQENLETEAELDTVRMPFWMCCVSATGILDLRRLDVQQQFGFNVDDLISPDWSLCHQLRARLEAGTVMGVIAPSAVLPEVANLTLFGPRRAISWGQEPALASTVPAVQVALGRPPVGVLERVQLPRGQQELF